MNKRYVFDTNVLVSAALSLSSVPAQALSHALKTGILLRSDSTLLELSTVLQRPKFDPYVTQKRRQDFLNDFILAAEYILILTRIEACRDPKDNHFLELAVDGKADILVTGDQDLLILNPFRGVSIMTPNDFLKTLNFE